MDSHYGWNLNDSRMFQFLEGIFVSPKKSIMTTAGKNNDDTGSC